VRIAPLLALTVATFALGFGELMIAGILPDVARELHVSLGAAGALVGAYAATFVIVSAPLAIAAARIERRAALIGALLLVALANGMVLTGGDFTLVLAMRIVAAAGSAIATPIALAAVDSLAEPAARGRAHGIVFAGFAAASTIGVPLGVLIAERFDWRFAFGCVAASALAAAVLIALVMPRVPRATPLTWAAVANVVGGRPLQLTFAVSLLNLGAQYLVLTYIRPYIDATGRFDATAVAGLLLVYGAFGIVGNVAGGALVDRVGSYRTILFCLAGNLIVFLGFGLAMRSWPGAVAAMIAWALVSWGFAPAVNQRLGEDAHAAPELGLALNLTAFNAGIAFGSLAGGLAIANGGPLVLPAAAAVILACAGAIAWRNPRTQIAAARS
jgi:DHA1 family inner membrane transport protein